MNKTLDRVAAWAHPRIERFQREIAVLFSVLLHALMLAILLYSSKPTFQTQESAEGGARTRVRFIGEAEQAEQDNPSKETPPPTRASQVTPPPAASPVISTLVDRAEHPVPPKARITSDSRATRQPNPQPRPAQAQPQPPSPASSPTQSRAQEPTPAPPPTARRRPETWTGRPPGMIEEDTAPDNAALGSGPAVQSGRGRDMTGNSPSMELGGYLVYYDVLSETRLRDWKALGMKEVFFPLPGTRYLMACPIETAIRRGSGKCRAIAPDSPELPNIGDAREAITMMNVYRQGQLVWSGPGAYR